MTLTRFRLQVDLHPLEVLRHLGDKPYVVALIGSGWSHGEALIAYEPSVVLEPSTDPFIAVDQDRTSEPGFFGGWIGFWGYRLNRRLEHIPDRGARDLVRPDHQLGYFDRVIRLDRDGHWYAEGLASAEEVLRYAREVERLTSCRPKNAQPFKLQPFRSRHGRQRHLTAVAEAQERIAVGDIFQVNLCDRYDSYLSGDPLDVFERGSRALKPLYGAYVSWPGGAVASFSPELYLRRTGDRLLSSPIKGTSPRGADQFTDARARAALEASAKDVAENVMIVDLVRNDLARVCVAGTVEVPRLCAPEAHAVWHLTSDVEGELPPATGSGTALRATFPPGSVTGAPKHEAMRVIDELERHSRQVYTGGIGRAANDSLELNVAIRTLEFGRPDHADAHTDADKTGWVVHLGAGSAITTASEPTAEWLECRAKVAPIASALDTTLAPAESEHDQGAHRPTRHLAATPALAPRATAGAGRAIPDSWLRPSRPRPVSLHQPHVVFIDNYDSFVHNLVDMVQVEGAYARVIRNDEASVEDLLDQQQRGLLTHLVVSPGPGKPADAGVSVAAIQALAATTPVLGVCLGHQAIVEAFGAEIVRAPSPVHGRSDFVFHDGTGLWRGLQSPFISARYHSLVAREDTLPPDLRVTARSSDGLIMGVAHRHLPIWGLQGHPESVLTPRGVDLLANFLSRTAARPSHPSVLRTAARDLVT